MTFMSFSQNDSVNKEKSSSNKVNEIKASQDKKEAAYFLNSRLVSSKILEGINPNDIEAVNVKKGDTIVDGKKFYGKLFITLKKDKEYEFLSLKEIRDKYTDVKNDNVLYMINGNFIEEDEEKYFIEKSYFLRAIPLAKYNAYLKKKEMEIINIHTRTSQNLNPKIIIKGSEVSETE
jgi:hypothetical protein